MANKEIWKVGKFDGGLNTYTDAKDIKAGEFVDFTDVFNGKIGVAAPMGRAMSSTDISPGVISDEGLFEGKGYGNFKSDHSFEIASDSHIAFAYSSEENAEDGSHPEMFFKIKSLLWLFEDVSTHNNYAYFAEPQIYGHGLQQNTAFEEITEKDENLQWNKRKCWQEDYGAYGYPKLRLKMSKNGESDIYIMDPHFYACHPAWRNYSETGGGAATDEDYTSGGRTVGRDGLEIENWHFDWHTNPTDKPYYPSSTWGSVNFDRGRLKFLRKVNSLYGYGSGDTHPPGMWGWIFDNDTQSTDRQFFGWNSGGHSMNHGPNYTFAWGGCNNNIDASFNTDYWDNIGDEDWLGGLLGAGVSNNTSANKPQHKAADEHWGKRKTDRGTNFPRVTFNPNGRVGNSEAVGVNPDMHYSYWQNNPYKWDVASCYNRFSQKEVFGDSGQNIHAMGFYKFDGYKDGTTAATYLDEFYTCGDTQLENSGAFTLPMQKNTWQYGLDAMMNPSPEYDYINVKMAMESFIIERINNYVNSVLTIRDWDDNLTAGNYLELVSGSGLSGTWQHAFNVSFGQAGEYTQHLDVSQTSSSASGTGFKCDIRVTDSGTKVKLFVVDGGKNYAASEKITINDPGFVGEGSANYVEIRVVTVSGAQKFKAEFVNSTDKQNNAHFTPTENDDIRIYGTETLSTYNGYQINAEIQFIRKPEHGTTESWKTSDGSGQFIDSSNSRQILSDAKSDPCNIYNEPPLDYCLHDPNTNKHFPMVVSGTSVLSGGVTGTAFDIYKFSMFGDPSAGDIINLKLDGLGSAFNANPLTSDNLPTPANQTGWVQHTTAADTVEGLVTELVTIINAFHDLHAAENIQDGWQYILAVAESDDYEDGNNVLVIKSDTSGAAYHFNATMELVGSYGSYIYEPGTADELSLLTFRGDNQTLTGDSSNDEAVKYHDVALRVYSSQTLQWYALSENADEGEVIGIFDWLYLKSDGYYNPLQLTGPEDASPLYWDEGSVCRIVDSNLKLPNDSFWFGFKDIRPLFPAVTANSVDYAAWPWGTIAPVVGFFLEKNDKKWLFTASNTDLDTGLWVDATDSTPSITANHAQMRFYFDDVAGTDTDWTGTVKIYAAAYYDDGSESLPGHQFTHSCDFVTEGNAMKIGATIRPETVGGASTSDLCFPDHRIVGIRLYYTHSEDSYSTFWELGLAHFAHGFTRADEITTPDNTDGNLNRMVWTNDGGNELNLRNVDNGNIFLTYNTMPKVRTYQENNNGINPDNETLSVRYKAHCIAGRRSFVGNIRIDVGGVTTFHNDTMIFSSVNSLDVFPYGPEGNILDLDISDGDEIVALASLGDKVLQFKKNIMYVVNIASEPSTWFVEDRYRYRGVLNKDAITEIEGGVFWVNQQSAYLYDGEDVQDLVTGSDDDNENRRIDPEDWSSFVTEDTVVGCNIPSREVFVIKKTKHTSATDGDAYVYNLTTKSWAYGKHKFSVYGADTSTTRSMTNIENVGNTGTLGFLFEGSLSDPPTEIGDEG